MINAVDEVLKQLLIREIPIQNGEVDIEFDQPTREWGGRLNRPTLNLFLYDMRENATLRKPEWQINRNGDGSVSKERSPERVDLSYMITAWAKEAEDEHRLLARTTMALYRHPHLPERLLPEVLQAQPVPIPLRVARHDKLTNPAEVWSALDNEIRPSISCEITLALNPYETFTGPAVLTRELRFGQADDIPWDQSLREDAGSEEFWMVGGEIKTDQPVDALELTLVERGLSIPLTDQRQFIVGNLEEGEYTLEVKAEGEAAGTHKIQVPAESYDVEL